MLTADAAARRDAKPQDLGRQRLHPLPHPRLIGAVKDEGVKVAVAGMEHIGHRQAVALAQFADGPHHFRERRARHHPVLEVVAGEATAEGRDRRLAPLPQPGPVVGLAGQAHRAGPGLAAALGGQLQGHRHLLLLAVELHQQHRGRIGGVLLGAQIVVDRLNAEAIHHLHSSRQNAGDGDAPHRFGGRLHRGEIGQQHRHTGRRPQQTQGDGRGDAEGALTADEHAAQVELGGFGQAAAQGGDGAIGKHHLHRQHVVAGNAVLQAVHPTGVLGHIAADAAHHLAGGIGGVVKTVACHRPGDPTVDHPRLHGDAAVGQVDLQHLSHPGGGDHQGRGFGHGTAGEARAAAAGHEGHPLAMAEAKQGRHLVGGFRQHHQGRFPAVQGEAVAVVSQQLLAGGHHAPGRQDGAAAALDGRPVDRGAGRWGGDRAGGGCGARLAHRLAAQFCGRIHSRFGAQNRRHGGNGHRAKPCTNVLKVRP